MSTCENLCIPQDLLDGFSELVERFSARMISRSDVRLRKRFSDAAKAFIDCHGEDLSLEDVEFLSKPWRPMREVAEYLAIEPGSFAACIAKKGVKRGKTGRGFVYCTLSVVESLVLPSVS